VTQRSDGGFAPFADPDLGYREAGVVWSPDVFGSSLFLAKRGVNDTGSFSVLAVPFLRRSLRDADGIWHVVLERDDLTLILRIAGVEDLKTPSAFEFKGLATHRALDAASRLKLFHYLTQPSARRPKEFASRRGLGRTVNEALIGVTGDLFGLSRRQIAAQMFGERRTSDDWSSTSWMKQRVSRAIDRGHANVDGGYLALLK
jgi:hypothetical protein